MIVVALVWASAGLIVCTYWQIPLSSDIYHGGRDIFQPHHSYNSKGSSYTDSRLHDSDVSQKGNVIQSFSQHTNGRELGDEFQTYNLNQEASNVSYRFKHVNSLEHSTSALQAHQSSLRYNDSLKSQKINFGNLANEVFIRKGVGNASISENHQTYKNSNYEHGNILVRDPLLGKWTRLKKAGRRENQIIMASGRGESNLKINRSSKLNQGAPRVILLLTRWRSGSTFLGELLASAVPETFYSYEPLHPWKIRMLEEDDSYTRAAHTLLRDLFQCHMEPHPGHVAYMARSHWYLRWNTRLSSQCTPTMKVVQGTQDRVKYQESREQQQKLGHEKQLFNASQGLQKVVWQVLQESRYEALDHNEKVQLAKERPGLQDKDRKQQEPSSSRLNVGKRPSCDDASFVSDVCRRSSLHVAKVVRLSLRQAMPLLEDENLSLQVVYLVRDPRAVLSSRSRLPWCVAAACRDPYTVCSSLQRDLLLIPRLLRRFPTR
ncbi:uncharacterized protein LOC123520593 isoform X2 [Portunus trituberculatus]|nr:uncharacterized protein LOC123520593 isoform X2 [Portunus trituberculatus]